MIPPINKLHKALARYYEYLLSLLDPRANESEPSATDLGRHVTKDSPTEASAAADITPINPALQPDAVGHKTTGVTE